jgi:hypothetical protein
MNALGVTAREALVLAKAAADEWARQGVSLAPASPLTARTLPGHDEDAPMVLRHRWLMQKLDDARAAAVTSRAKRVRRRRRASAAGAQR